MFCFVVLLFVVCFFLFYFLFLFNNSISSSLFKLPIRSEIYNCTNKNTNKVSIINNIRDHFLFGANALSAWAIKFRVKKKLMRTCTCKLQYRPPKQLVRGIYHWRVAIFKRRNGESGNGESLKAGIFKMGNL